NLQALGADVHPVTLDRDGIDIDELRALLSSGVRPTLAHIIPNFQNPAGVTLSAERRTALLELAERYDFTICEGAPYADVRSRGERPPSLLSRDTQGRVVHASSFTKTVCPGVRVGSLVAPKPVIDAIAKRATSLYISPVMVTE